MLGWFWEVLLEDPPVELEADGPPGVERPGVAFSDPGTLRRPSRSAADARDGPCSRGGGGGRPGDEVKSAPALAREGGLRGSEEPEPLTYGRDTLVEGVGGRMEDEAEAIDDADDVGLTGVLLLLMPYMCCDRPDNVRKGLGLERGEFALWRLLLPFMVLGRGTVPEEWEGRQDKETEEVEEVTGSGKFCSWLFS